MAQFYTGELKTAQVTMRNPTERAFDYNACIYLGTDLALAAETAFYLEPGEEEQVSFSVVMPASPGTYPVHVGVFSGGENIALYRATEDLVVVAPEPFMEVTPDVYGPGQVWSQFEGSGCSLDGVKINGVDLEFDPVLGKYDTFTVAVGQLCTMEVTAGAWLTPKVGYWPSYGMSWAGAQVTDPNGGTPAAGAGPLHQVNGHYEANKDVYTEVWQWTAALAGKYQVLVAVRHVPYW